MEEKYYLIEVRNVGPNSPRFPNDTTYLIQDYPGRTNQSGEIRIDGWLGTTREISRTAHGAFDTVEAAVAAIPEGFVPGAPGAMTFISKYERARRAEISYRKVKRI